MINWVVFVAAEAKQDQAVTGMLHKYHSLCACLTAMASRREEETSSLMIAGTA